MPSIGTFSAWIETDGIKLEEYSVEYSPQEKKATCWVASQEGKVFKIGYRNSISTYTTCTTARIDGTKTARTTFPASMRNEFGKFRGLRMSDNSRKQFQFAKYRLLEDEDSANANLSPHVGEISVHIHRVKEGPPVPRGPLKKFSLPPLEVSEKAKKGLVHGIELGQNIAAKRPSETACPVTKLGKVATFVFKYRPLDVLRADGVVPLAAPARECSTGGPQRRINGSLSRRHFPASVQGDIIDLTLDSEDEVDTGEAELSVLKTRFNKKRKHAANDDDAGGSVKKEIKTE